jgi:hypothetical protein
LGNTTELCNVGASGASGTLTCTLPNVNGTYNAFFTGTDANLLTYQLSYKQITIGNSTTAFGRDAFIAVLILFMCAAVILTGNVAVMMILGCLGLFFALGVGLLPLTTAPIVIFFTLIAFVLSFKLKV